MEILIRCINTETFHRRSIYIAKIGRRECYLFKVGNYSIESLINIVKSVLDKMSLPGEYGVNIYPGKYGVNVVIEITGPEEEKIKNIDLRVTSKILEICEKRDINCHIFERLEIF